MVDEKPPITSLKQLKAEIERLKKQVHPVDSQLLLRLLGYVESREKLTKELLIHMNAVENHLVRVTELMQKMPQVNVGLLADSLQAMIPKLDEISYNTRKMVDYLEIAADIGEEKEEVKEKPQKEAKPKKESKDESEEGKEGTVKQLEKIEEQNKSLIGALTKLSDNLENVGSK